MNKIILILCLLLFSCAHQVPVQVYEPCKHTVQMINQYTTKVECPWPNQTPNVIRIGEKDFVFTCTCYYPQKKKLGKLVHKKKEFKIQKYSVKND